MPNVTYEMRFWEVILGVLMEDPMMLLPEKTIPLQRSNEINLQSSTHNGENHGDGDSHVGPGEGVSAIEDLLPALIVTRRAGVLRHYI